ncbi:MAG: hypothetical protein JSV65_14170 [Armatimonadota bacterium]|nr:MAG: hypothetical protein JSV65_14170 [Armatimonadota bacterium]
MRPVSEQSDPAAGVCTARRRAELFRGTVRSLARDAAQAMNDLEPGEDVASESGRAKVSLVLHYLDYLIRLSERQA